LQRFTSAYRELVVAKRRRSNMVNGSDAALLEEDEKSSTERARDWAEMVFWMGKMDQKWSKWVKTHNIQNQASKIWRKKC
jgi:hypothetical protein